MRTIRLATCLVAALSGCAGPQLSIELPAAEAWQIREFRKGGLANECTLAPQDPRRAALQSWLSRNSRGWTQSTQMYLAGTLVTGPGFALNLSPVGVAVLSYGQVQYTKSSFTGVLPDLRCPPKAPVRR
jgi:hypothetical protein